MAASGKNIGLIVIAVVAIGGAVYLLTQAMGGGGTVDQNERVYFVLLSSEGSDNPVGVTMSRGEFQSRMRNRNPIEIDGSTEVAQAGVCPDGHYYALTGHGEQPPACPTCSMDLGPYDIHGNRVGGQ